MQGKLNGLKVAILIADGFEQVEMEEPKNAIEKAGGQTKIISPSAKKVKGWHHFDPADEFIVDIPLDNAKAEDYDALLLPGGVINPDQLRLFPKAIEFIRKMAEANKPIAAICHGPWTLINAKAVKGYTVTSWLSLRVDLENAGAKWVDQEVVSDRNLVTSRKPADIPAFNTAMLDLFAKSNANKNSS